MDMHKENKSVDVVIPVYNEEACLSRNIEMLYTYLGKISNFSWKIIIADNASVDETLQIAKKLSAQHKRITYFHLPAKGKGRALRKAFLRSSADLVCCMDADLSTNLRYLRILFEGIACGFDLAVGTRLMQASMTKRRWNREIISKMYNCMIKCLFFNKFSDAHCGFKVLKTDVAKKLIPLIENNGWFFDAELLLLAEYNNYRIFEVPVEWTEDIKSKVNIPKTVIEDLLGMARLRCTINGKKVK